jgi:hypothetical protein
VTASRRHRRSRPVAAPGAARCLQLPAFRLARTRSARRDQRWIRSARRDRRRGPRHRRARYRRVRAAVVINEGLPRWIESQALLRRLTLTLGEAAHLCGNPVKEVLRRWI